MSSFNWRVFLDRWNDEMLTLLELRPGDRTPAEQQALDRGWLGFPGAAEEQIAAAEARLQTALPASYREFLKVTDGWLQVGMDAETGRLFAARELEWFRLRYPASLENWMAGGAYEVSDEDYFVYGPGQDPVNMRSRYLSSALAISEEIDAAIYLLNPEVRTADGEWEAWFFGYSLPGARRYRSFREMMVAERERVMNNLRALLGL